MAPELTVRQMVETKSWREIETSDLMEGDRVSEISLTVIVPRKDEKAMRAKFEEARKHLEA